MPPDGGDGKMLHLSKCLRRCHIPAHRRALLKLRLGCSAAVTTHAGARRHVDRRHRTCAWCSAARILPGAAPVDDEYHLTFECRSLQPIRDACALAFAGCDAPGLSIEERMRQFYDQGHQAVVAKFVYRSLKWRLDPANYPCRVVPLRIFFVGTLLFLAVLLLLSPLLLAVLPAVAARRLG
jgi:hypothetical protein